MNYQKTVRKSVVVKGVGVHSGKEVSLKMRPAKPGQGIVFKRVDLPGSPEVPALHTQIISTRLATTLGSGKVLVSTVEHLLAALYGQGIDNAILEVDGPEIPILDGSSKGFCEALSAAGEQTQCAPRFSLVLRKAVQFKIEEKWAFVEPSSRFEMDSSIEWDHPSVGYQSFKYKENSTDFSEVASARTFCFLRDVEGLKRAGLLKGGSLENAVVIDDRGVLNPEGLRYGNELVRHKVLDALGDFKLMGFSVQGYFRLHRGGHELHHLLMTEIFKDPENYDLVGVPTEQEKVSVQFHSAIAKVGLAASF